MTQTTETLLEFPCQFPIKIMGRMEDGFADTMTEIVLRHIPDFDAKSLAMRPSSGNKYLSLTFTIHATSKPQLDDLYREVSAHPLVVMAL
jgi:putative lipoic acid-binding regulatory protein